MLPANHNKPHRILKLSGMAVLLLVPLICFTGCAPDSAGDGPVVVSINDYTVTLDEFRARLAHEVSLYHDFVPDQQSTRAFLDEMIRKEVLIQEAQRLKLDRSEKFIKTIERYWEATLVRNLLEMKGDELDTNVVISREEITAYYNRTRRPQDAPKPTPDAEKQLIKVLKEDKKTKLLAAWIDTLKAQADIKIDEALLLKK